MYVMSCGSFPNCSFQLLHLRFDLVMQEWDGLYHIYYILNMTYLSDFLQNCSTVLKQFRAIPRTLIYVCNLFLHQHLINVIYQQSDLKCGLSYPTQIRYAVRPSLCPIDKIAWARKSNFALIKNRPIDYDKRGVYPWIALSSLGLDKFAHNKSSSLSLLNILWHWGYTVTF